MEQYHQELKKTEEELVPLKSETPCLSEATEAIHEISVSWPSKFLISIIPTSFDKNFDPISMNNIIEAENSSLNQPLKRLLMISNIIIWKV